MAKILGSAWASRRLVLGAVGGLAVAGAATWGLDLAVDRWALAFVPGSTGDWVLFALAIASGLFVAAGVVRLVTWRFEHHGYSALLGTAMLLMGACLPLGGLARLWAPENSHLVSLTTRAVASLLVMGLVLLGLRAAGTTRPVRPTRLLLVVFALVSGVFLLLLTGRELVRADDATLSLAVLSTALTLGWFSLALRTATDRTGLSWTRRATVVYVGMGVAELLRFTDGGKVGYWTLCGVLVCAGAGALALRSGLMDLDHAVRTGEFQRNHLTEALDRASGEADELTVWREQLTHDARNACAGLRAAMDILERYAGQVDPATTARLRMAAVEEVGHLEHLLARSADQPIEPFDVAQVVRSVGDSARALGHDVMVETESLRAVGRSGDVAAVLKNLLSNARTHAAGSTVRLQVAGVVTAHGDAVRITCSDDGAGFDPDVAARCFERGFRGRTSPGSGLGLHGARQLMREQGGELELGAPSPGATLVLTLPLAPARPQTPNLRLVPAQRTSSSRPIAQLDQLNPGLAPKHLGVRS
jgi:signal transduction histidine kinase